MLLKEPGLSGFLYIFSNYCSFARIIVWLEYDTHWRHIPRFN
ncbi:hypothetical protein SynRS9902_02318 [Synechococcus sp. RS9902]|nr:hypothetical protein SynRS9902_02318 [Synechococcus sp. RS9902]